MTLNPDSLDELRDALEGVAEARRAWERRVAMAYFDAAATPDVVAALVRHYDAVAPQLADWHQIATQMRVVADRVDSFGVRAPETAGIVAVISVSGETLERTAPMAFTLQTDQTVTLTVAYTDRHGNPAQVESQTWTSSDENVLTVTDNGDGNATATSTGTTGTAQIQLVADARFGEGTDEIRAVLDVEVVAAEAVNAVITPGEPTDVGAPAGGGETPPADTGTATPPAEPAPAG